LLRLACAGYGTSCRAKADAGDNGDWGFPAKAGSSVDEKPKKVKGIVEKIIKSIGPDTSEKAQIELQEAEHLYREIRIKNEL
jgi:hypothetical protein